MTATDELRRLLDERGVEWEGSERSIRWRDRNGIMMQAFPLADGELGLDVWSCTPAQAIAATLGDADATGERQGDAGTCHMELPDLRGPAFTDVYVCSECGGEVMVGTVMGESDVPKWCPWCGRKVEDEC